MIVIQLLNLQKELVVDHLKIEKRKPRYGTTTPKGSCPDRLEQLVNLLLSGKISEDEYKKRKEQWDRDCR